LLFTGEAPDFLLVAAKSQPLVQRTRDLSFQLTNAPGVPHCFNLVESAFLGIVDGQENDVVRPSECEVFCQRSEHIVRKEQLVGDALGGLVRPCWPNPRVAV